MGKSSLKKTPTTTTLLQALLPGEKMSPANVGLIQEVFLLLFHIELGLMKHSVKIMDQNGSRFLYINRNF
jgi:hypothetical protein